MKINIWKSALVIAAAIASFAACTDPVEKPSETPKDPDPVFPANVINKTVVAGEAVTITIEPNLAWEVSVSGTGSGTEFWLDDDGIKKSKISGKQAGTVTVTVVFANDEKFDVNRVCDVNLTMAGQTKKIAVLTLPSINRSCEIFAGTVVENEFNGEFAADKVSEVTLVSFPGETGYAIPVRVVTNFAWQLASDSWLKVTANNAAKDNVESGSVGATEFIVSAILSDDNKNGAEGTMKFIDPTNTAASYELKVKLPAYQDRIEMELLTTFTFNAAGHVLNLNESYIEGLPALVDLLAVDATEVKVVEWNDEQKYHAATFAEWATVTETRYDTYTAADMLAKYTVEITVDANPLTTMRYADVFIVPASKAGVALDDWFDASTGALKQEFAGYIIGRISQDGQEEENEEEGGDGDNGTTGQKPEFVLASGTAEFVKLGEDSEIAMVLGSELSITDVYQLKTKEKSVALSVEAVAEWGAKELQATPPFAVRESPLFHVEPSFDSTISTFMITTEAKEHAEAIIVIMEPAADEVSMVNYAAIHVIYDADAAVEIPSPFAFVDPAAAEGLATITACTGDILANVLSEQYNLTAEKVWMLTYKKAEASDLLITVPGIPYGSAAYNATDPNTGMPITGYWLTYKMSGTNKMRITMAKAGEVDYFLWYDALYKPQCVLVCTMESAE